MSEEISFTAIDPEGDVMLELSRPAGKTHLQVSSRVLSLTSPVFAKMFRSQFKESLRSNEATATRPLLIPLPEEDEEAFTILCNIIHYQMGGVPRTPSPDCLVNLAVACDKWDFTKAITHSAEFWLQEANSSVAKDLNKYLFVAYVLDAPCAFLRISWEIINCQTGPFTCLPGLTDHDLIPKSMLCESRGLLEGC
jgi:hypothetical protein